jgi:hypothetical protein
MTENLTRDELVRAFKDACINSWMFGFEFKKEARRLRAKLVEIGIDEQTIRELECSAFREGLEQL